MNEAPKVDAAMVRALYPNPSTCNGALGKGMYCVLGALQRFRDGIPESAAEHDYPEAYFYGSRLLLHFNRHLCPCSATMSALHIAQANDQGRFDDAWKMLDTALSYEDEVE